MALSAAALFSMKAVNGGGADGGSAILRPTGVAPTDGGRIESTVRAVTSSARRPIRLRI